MVEFRVGFDIGGTKIAGALLGPDGKMLAKERWPVPDDYQGFLDILAAAVAHFDSLAGQQASVGLSVAGIHDHKARVLTVCKLPWLVNVPFADALGARLQRPVAMANDADCFAVSEALDGAGVPYRHVFGAILGTGVGGAQVVDKKLVAGPNGVNGEWGHLPLPYYTPEDGPLLPCHCGRTGCMDMLISGGGLERLYQFKHQSRLAAREIAYLATQYDAKAMATLAHFYQMVAKGMSMIVMCMDPDAIVIGGGLRALPGLCEGVKKNIPRYCFVKDLKTAFLPALYDDDSGVRGAAWLE